MSTILKLYVSENCWGCVEARKIAEEVRVEFADVLVEIVEHKSSGDTDWPDKVIATPTYELNDKIISLGNPSREDLFKLLSEAVEHITAKRTA